MLQDTPQAEMATFQQTTSNKDTPTTSSALRKSVEKSKLIQSCLLRGNIAKHKRSQSNMSENYPNGAAPPNNNKQIIINQQHYFTDSIKIYQNDPTSRYPANSANPSTAATLVPNTQVQTSRQNSTESKKQAKGKKRFKQQQQQ